MPYTYLYVTNYYNAMNPIKVSMATPLSSTAYIVLSLSIETSLLEIRLFESFVCLQPAHSPMSKIALFRGDGEGVVGMLKRSAERNACCRLLEVMADSCQKRERQLLPVVSGLS